MFTENAIQLELHRRGKVETIEIQQSRMLIGSGAHCDLRLSPDEAAIEQLEVEARDDEIHVRVCAFDPPCKLNGAPFLAGRLSNDALLELGAGTALRLAPIALSVSEKKPKKRGSETHPAVQGLGLVGVVIGLYMVMPRSGEVAGALELSQTPPALSFQAVSCSQSEAEPALALATRLIADAESKRERSPFYAKDGVAAVRSYLRAEACFRTAGEAQSAQEAAQSAEALRLRLADELRARHLRLERLLAEQRYADLKREVRRVSELVEERAHPYAAWLSQLGREAEIRNSAQKRK